MYEIETNEIVNNILFKRFKNRGVQSVVLSEVYLIIIFFVPEPWLGRKKKPVKKKKKAALPKKKASTTQDKIETMFERKNSAASSATVTVTTPAGHSVTGTPVGTNGLYLGMCLHKHTPTHA